MYVPRPKTSLEGHNGPPHGYVTVRPVRLGTPCSVHVSPRKSFFLLAWMAPSPSPLPLRRSTDFRFLDALLLGPVWTKQRKGTRRGEVDSWRLHGRWWFDDDSMIPIPAEVEDSFLGQIYCRVGYPPWFLVCRSMNNIILREGEKSFFLLHLTSRTHAWSCNFAPDVSPFLSKKFQWKLINERINSRRNISQEEILFQL